MLRTLLRTSLWLLATCSLWAGPCATTTLDQYIALPMNVGCTVGPLIMENFNFMVLAMTGSPVIAAATDITVTPQIGAEYGLSFSSPKFTESGENSVTYLITYAEDPTGSIRSLDDYLNDPVNPPGKGQVDDIGCLDGMWWSSPGLSVCSTGNVTRTVTVFDAGNGNNMFFDSTTFDGVHVLGIQKTIFLTGDVFNNNTPGGSVTIDSFTTQSFVPEPGTIWLAAVLVVGLLFLGKARLKRVQIRHQSRA